MPDLKTQFENSQRALKTLSKRPANEELLALHALFRQATDGDAPRTPPATMSAVDRARYDAWAKLRGTDAELAMQCYINIAKQLTQ